ncbi:hypothetical protein N2152v2_002917 [Parachlorella kessleri]
MLCTRAESAFELEYPLFHALIAEDAQAVTALCASGEAAKCGPGNLSALMLALLLGKDQQLPQLMAATAQCSRAQGGTVKAPLDACLTGSFSDPQLEKWLTAAHLKDMAVMRHQLVAKRTALDLAVGLGKVEQAKALLAAGAGLQPLLRGPYWGGRDRSESPAGQAHREHVRQYVLSVYSGDRLGSASAAILGQVARLALQAGQPHECLAALQAAAKRRVQLSRNATQSLFKEAVDGQHVDITMHVVQHSLSRLHHLLVHMDSPSPSLSHPPIAAVLFPYLAQQFAEGRLQLPYGLGLILELALKANQPDAALSMLQAVVHLEPQQKGQLERQQPGDAMHSQQQQLLSRGSLNLLLLVAACRGFPAVVAHLLGQGADVHFLCREPYVWWSQSTAEYPDIHPNAGAVLFPVVVQHYKEGRLKVDGSRQLALVMLRAALCGQDEACVTLLRLAAARQQPITDPEAWMVTLGAAAHGQGAVVLHRAEQLGKEMMIRLLKREYHVNSSVMRALVQHFRQQLTAGALQLDSTLLGLLVREAAAYQMPHVSLAFLEAGAQQQLQLTREDRSRTLAACAWRGGAELMRQLLAVGPPLTTAEACKLAGRAAPHNQAEVLEVLLGAGALVDAGMVRDAVWALACSCVPVLLRLGPSPMDLSKLPNYSCPLLRVLEVR